MAYGAVHRPPYAGARGLADWAVDLWPYVNGRAIMSGVSLRDMDASDALDVIHFIFEDDVLSSKTKEELDVKNALRTSVYEQFYKTRYKYQNESSGLSNIDDELVADEDSYDDEPTPVDPMSRGGVSVSKKPYIAPTAVNADSGLPFGRGIDAPLG